MDGIIKLQGWDFYNKGYVTRGCGNEYRKELFRPVKNNVSLINGVPHLSFNKPESGGLWACSVQTDDWFHYAKTEMPWETYTKICEELFTFILKDDARILHFYQVADVMMTVAKCNRLPLLSKSSSCLDFEALSEKYDVIMYHLNEDRTPPNDDLKWGSLYWALYGWDVDCILVLNKDAIIPAESNSI